MQWGMVVDIFHHDTLQHVSNSPPPGVSFAISNEDKRRLIYWHLLAKMLVYSKGRKTLSCTDILRLAKNRLVINSVNYVFDVPWIIADSTFCIVFKVHLTSITWLLMQTPRQHARSPIFTRFHGIPKICPFSSEFTVILWGIFLKKINTLSFTSALVIRHSFVECCQFSRFSPVCIFYTTE